MNKLKEFQKIVEKNNFIIFRVLLGIVLFIDFVSKFINFDMFYTEEGILPLSIVKLIRIDLFFTFDIAPFKYLILFLYIIATLGFIYGKKYRIYAFGIYILNLLLMHRNIFVGDNFDILVQLILPLSIILPLDGELFEEKLVKYEQSNILQLKIKNFVLGVFYAFMFYALTKNQVHWTWVEEYSAFSLILNNPNLSRFMIDAPELLKTLNYLYIISIKTFAFMGITSLIFLPFLKRYVQFSSIFVSLIGLFVTIFLKPITFGLCLLLFGLFSFQANKAKLLILPRPLLKKNNIILPIIYFLVLFAIRAESYTSYRVFGNLFQYSHFVAPMKDWNFYSPRPYNSDSWYFVEYKTSDNYVHKLYEKNAKIKARPIVDSIDFYYYGQYFQDYNDLGQGLAKYFCRLAQKNYTDKKVLEVAFSREAELINKFGERTTGINQLSGHVICD